MSCSQVWASAPCTWTAVRAQLAAASPAAALGRGGPGIRGCGAGIAEAGCCRVRQTARTFQADVVVGQRMFDALECPDRTAELTACLGVLDGAVQSGTCHADQVGSGG